MSKVFVDRELLEQIVNTNMADYAVIAYQHKEIRSILAQPAEAEGAVEMGSDAWMALHLLDRLDVSADEEPRVQQVEEIVRRMGAALSAVTAERDRLREDSERLKRAAQTNWNEFADSVGERDRLRAEVEALRLDATLGSAIQRACCDLPDGFMISVSLEKDAGTLELCLPDTDAVLDDFDGETFADQIHAAIDAAKAAKEA